MSTVAVWSPSDMDTSAMRNLAAAVACGSLDDDIADAVTWAAQVHALAKLRENAAELTLEATRLECIIARRAAQIGRLDCYKKPAWVAAAKGFATLTDDEFRTLLEGVVKDRSISTIWSDWDRAARYSARVGRIARGLYGDPVAIGSSVDDFASIVPPTHEFPLVDRGAEDGEYVRETAGELLASLTRYGVPFTTAEDAEKLAQILDVDIDDVVTRTGMQVMVREAVATENRGGKAVALPDGTTVAIPAVVTIEDTTVNNYNGWVRIPWSAAGLDQLGAMCAHRRRQIADMAAAARRLEHLHAALSVISQSDEDFNCQSLLDRLLSGDYPRDVQLPIFDPEAEPGAIPERKPYPIRRRRAS